MTAGGIAGVASNFKGPSIKVYGGRQKYQEWEFIFSMNKQVKAPVAANPLGPTGPGGSTTTPPVPPPPPGN
jgi:hypothetical protein